MLRFTLIKVKITSNAKMTRDDEMVYDNDDGSPYLVPLSSLFYHH